MKVALALLKAQARNAWNRMRRESGIAAPVASLGVLALVAMVLVLPGLMTLGLGLGLGEELRASPESGLLQRWNAFQALFTVVFAFFGGFRHRLAFDFREIGRFPVTPLQWLLAEIPASLFEVFPLLGTAGILCSNLGLAIRLPSASPLVAVLALQGIVAMVALLFVAGTVRRWLLKRRAWAFVLGLGVAIAALGLGKEGLRTLFRSSIPDAIPFLPGSQGYAGLLEVWHGHPAAGLARIAVGLAATVALLVLAAWLHHRGAAVESASAGPRLGAARLLRFRRPAAGVGRLFQKQLLDSKSGRLLLFLPLMLSAPAAVVAWAIRYDAAREQYFADKTTQIISAFETAPVLEAFLVLIVIFDSKVWMNQFGWDGRGIRTLLHLPISPRDLLLGKMLGLTRFVGLQSLIGVPPLLFISIPSLGEALAGIGAAGTVLLAGAGMGQWLSIRFPRRVSRDGGASPPFYLSFVPTLLVLAVAAGLTTVHALAEKAGRWGPPAALLALSLAIATLYAVALPALSSRLRRERERLCRM